MTRYEFQIDKSLGRSRLDEFLFDRFGSMSKAYLRGVVKEGFCEVNGYVENTGRVLKANDFVEIEVDSDFEKGMRPEEFALDIVFEDEEIIVVNKPTAMLVHPTNYERNGTLLNALHFHLNKRKIPDRTVRPHLVHRLDRGTSGLIVTAKNVRAARILCKQIKENVFEKEYEALVGGIVESESGTIEEPIGRFENLKRWDVMPDGKASETRFQVADRNQKNTRLKLLPITGRTNQIRIHCAFIGHPIVGDSRYGGEKAERLYLHASKVKFRHPRTNETLRFRVDSPF